MGGALNSKIWNLPTKRVDKLEYERVIHEITQRVTNFAPYIKFRPLRCFSEKQSHGDVDFLCEVRQATVLDWRGFLKELSGYEPHKNGFTISVPYDGFQCDFNFVSEESYEIAYVYHSWETGMLMGVVANQMGLSYGHRGLYLQVPLSYFNPSYPDHEYREVLISRDWRAIFAELGFNSVRFEKGFANFQEMAAWVADSLYFKPEIFAFDALNSINRTRNRKRPVYAEFVEWCKSQPPNNDMPSKKDMLEYLIKDWSGVAEKVEAIRAEIILNHERHAKFNGHIVKEIRSLEGAELGRFIVAFKASKPDFLAWLDSQTALDVCGHIAIFPFDTAQKPAIIQES